MITITTCFNTLDYKSFKEKISGSENKNLLLKNIRDASALKATQEKAIVQLRTLVQENTITPIFLFRLKNYFYFHTVGGNHTRTVVVKSLLKLILMSHMLFWVVGEGNFHCFQTAVYYNLPIKLATVIGVLDDILKLVTFQHQ